MAPQRQLVLLLLLLLLLLEPLGGEDSGAAHRSESYARARDASQQHSSEIVLLHDVRHQPPPAATRGALPTLSVLWLGHRRCSSTATSTFGT